MCDLKTWMALAVLMNAGSSQAIVRAIDLSDPGQRARQPLVREDSFTGGVEEGGWTDGPWCYRFRMLKPARHDECPSVTLVPTVSDWSGYDRFVIDIYNSSSGGDTLRAFIAGSEGPIQAGLSALGWQPLADNGLHRWIIDLRKWPVTTSPKNISRINIYHFTHPISTDVHMGGFYLLKPGEALPPLNQKFVATVACPARKRARADRHEARASALRRFREQCRAVGQSDAPAWIGKATSMSKIRPRDAFVAEPAVDFSLRLARGEYESFQVLVVPNGNRNLSAVGVEASAEGIDPKAFKTSVVGYVKTENQPPYKIAGRAVTNESGRCERPLASASSGWWPDPILDWMEKTDVQAADLQSFWVRLKCPRNQRAGTYRGVVAVSGDGWRKEFPLTVRVYDFEIPKASPLPLAVSFEPEPFEQEVVCTATDLACARRIRADPLSPVNIWKRHELEWGDFLADHFITMDSLYHRKTDVHWEVLLRLKEQGRLGLFNLGAWHHPADLTPEACERWRQEYLTRFDVIYAKAKEYGLLDHAYMYGCDECGADSFPAIAYAVNELKARYPDVPLLTTSFDYLFGTKDSPLAKLDWFTPDIERFPKYAENVPDSRAAGHRVWWYTACIPLPPYACMHVEDAAIEHRQLMGAHVVKWRPDGFLYYQLSMWNSPRPIDGSTPFTDWNPRSWMAYHGDGSWFCCGPDGIPCGTIRTENFRDGLEDYAYALEYERRTGKTCEVPSEVCAGITEFTDDPAVYYRWRDRLAEAIEAEVAK